MIYDKNHPLRVCTLCSGYDSQCLALKYLKDKHSEFDFDLVAWSEIDKSAITAHNILFPEYKDRNLGDMSKIMWDGVKDFDMLTYSTPCQSVSTAGMRKGIEEGSGTKSSLLWYTRNAIIAKKPRYLLMENVKGLVTEKFRPFFFAWLKELESYGDNEDKTLYISKSLSDGLIRKTNANEVSSPKIIHIGDLPIGAKFAGKQRVFSIHGISPTLMENMYKDPKNYGCIPKVVVKNKVRKLSPFECFALMGVHKEDDYKLCNSGLKKTKLYKLSGNSIVTNCMTAMFEELLYPTGNSYVEKDGQLSLF